MNIKELWSDIANIKWQISQQSDNLIYEESWKKIIEIENEYNMIRGLPENNHHHLSDLQATFYSFIKSIEKDFKFSIRSNISNSILDVLKWYKTLSKQDLLALLQKHDYYYLRRANDDFDKIEFSIHKSFWVYNTIYSSITSDALWSLREHKIMDKYIWWTEFVRSSWDIQFPKTSDWYILKYKHKNLLNWREWSFIRTKIDWDTIHWVMYEMWLILNLHNWQWYKATPNEIIWPFKDGLLAPTYLTVLRNDFPDLYLPLDSNGEISDNNIYIPSIKKYTEAK